MERDTLVGTVALHCALAKMGRYVFDKKCMRYNNIADYVELVWESGPTEKRGTLPPELLYEAIETAFPTSVMYTGEPFNRNPYRWMEA